MQLYLKEDQNFNINNPYLYLKNFDSVKKYDIYTDGSYIKIGKESFCCIGGIILEHETSKKIGEFFAPINTKNSFGQQIIPNFEQISINTALLIQEKYNLKVFNIFNDNLSEISKNSKNKNVKWISREDNIADYVVTYCKNQWKEKNINIIQSFKLRNNLFNNIYDRNIFIIPYSRPKSCLYYFFAINEEKEIIDYIRFSKPNDFGFLELITKMLNSNFEKFNFNVNKSTFTRINNYVKGNMISSSEIKYYEDFFDMIEQNNFKFSLKSSSLDTYPKKKTILNYLGFNKF